MIDRSAMATVRRAARSSPVVTLTGPRQSGKTTLCRSAFKELPYASLERPTTRGFALEDPVGFLAQFPQGVVLDEIQRAPELLSYLQGMVDDDPRPGRFILTGSQHLGIRAAVAQSLAGRTAVLHLLPLSLEESRRFDPHAVDLDDLAAVLFAGGYPAIHDRKLSPQEWLDGYVATYVERDVRQLLNVGDLVSFQTFLTLAAGRTGQLLNLSSLASDAGITHNTAKAWLSVLEASFLVQRLPPFHTNLRKRLIKTPKLHFLDSGLLCYLLGIQSPGELVRHSARGAIFESWVAAEIYKHRLNRGLRANLHFYRDRSGLEVDFVFVRAARRRLLEAKSAQTVAGDFFDSLRNVAAVLDDEHNQDHSDLVLVHGGTEEQHRTTGHALPWYKLDTLEWT